MTFVIIMIVGIILAVQRNGIPMSLSGLIIAGTSIAMPLMAATAPMPATEPTEMGKVVLQQMLLAGLTLMYVGGITWQLNRGWKTA